MDCLSQCDTTLNGQDTFDITRDVSHCYSICSVLPECKS